MQFNLSPAHGACTLLRRLARDTRGNTLALMAAALFPLLAIVGGGVDISRGYLAQSRLQQACDAGVLGARKRLDNTFVKDGKLPGTANEAGNRLFEANFQKDMYGTTDRTFSMSVEPDMSVRGDASVVVPTTIMNLFGFDEMPLAVTCGAKLDFNHTDIMMVLDTTGSMGWTNKGDTMSRIDTLKATVKSFYANVTSSAKKGTRIRFGFVPYSTNVRVGHLLQKDWLADEWTYNYRQPVPNGNKVKVPILETKYTDNGGTVKTEAKYLQLYCPADVMTTTKVKTWTDLQGWINEQFKENGTRFSCTEATAGAYEVTPKVYVDHLFTNSQRQIGIKEIDDSDWLYDSFLTDVSFAKTGNPKKKFKIGGTAQNPTAVTVGFQGCIEERQTYEIDDFNNVDLTRALDLDIDLTPDPDRPETQWKPMIHELSYERQMGAGLEQFTKTSATSKANFWNAAANGWAGCPAAAMKLSELTSTQLDAYLSTLSPNGNTYHDIGMIWGGRLLSPSGIFASENADTGGVPVSRHLIFLTDGETAPLDLSYGAYGIEPLDQRRWNPKSSRSLTDTVEKRFSFACQEVKKRNIAVWVIAFGTDMTPMLSACSGPGRHFQANNAAELEAAFSKIAKTMGGLRISE